MPRWRRQAVWKRMLADDEMAKFMPAAVDCYFLTQHIELYCF
jgi:hypothetical protein